MKFHEMFVFQRLKRLKRLKREKLSSEVQCAEHAALVGRGPMRKKLRCSGQRELSASLPEVVIAQALAFAESNERGTE